MKTLYLIGFMGSGKSTVGDQLTRESSRIHLDTDHMIVTEKGAIASIFEKEGEDRFRSYEVDMLARIPSKNYVVSTGGGIIEREENQTLMTNNGLVIFLDTSFEEILTRLGDDESRPLWRNHDFSKYTLYKRRRPMYETLADITIHTDAKTPEIIAKEIMERLPEKDV